MALTPIVMIPMYYHSIELRQACTEWAKDHDLTMVQLIESLLVKIINSNDYSINIPKIYNESTEELTAYEIQSKRRGTYNLDPDLVNQIDKILESKDPKKRAKLRSNFINEAIRRYLEPDLLKYNYLKSPVFKDKMLAAKNIKLLRNTLGLSPKEFLNRFFAEDGNLLISYPQYLLIERSGKGNIDRLIELLSPVLKIEKDNFYKPNFSKYINYEEKKKF